MSDTSGQSAVGNTAADLKAMGDAARQVAGKASQAGADALQQAQDLAGDAKARAGSLLGAAGEKASSVAEEQKQNVAEYLEGVAKAVHQSGEQLEGHSDWVAHMVERGAAELSSLASTLRSNDLQSLMGDLGSLARRQPALFVGASMAAGFALARVGRIAATGSSVQASSQPSGAHASAPQPSSTPAPSGQMHAGSLQTGSLQTGASTAAQAAPPSTTSSAPASVAPAGDVGEKSLPYAMGYPGGQP